MTIHRNRTKLLVCGFLLFLCVGMAGEPTDKVLLQQSIPAVPSRLYAEASLAGRPGLVVLDTGSEFSTLDLSLQESVGRVVEDRNFKTPGAADRITKFFLGPPLRIGALLDEHPKVNLSDLNALGRTFGRLFVGIVGMNVLGRGKILLDYDGRIFRIHAGPWALRGGDFHEVALNKETGVPEFNAKIQGHPVAFTVDTGFDKCISLQSSVFDALVDEGIIEPARMDGRVISLGGLHAVRRGWFRKGELMGKNLAGVSVSSEAEFSRLGLEWLYAFNTEIDAREHKLRYVFRGQTNPPCSAALMVGAILSFNGEGALVEKLRPGGGAAENAGIKPGDLIQKFAALKGMEMNQTTIAETVTDQAGKEIGIRYLRKADGAQVSAKLKLPPVISDWNFGGRDIFNGK